MSLYKAKKKRTKIMEKSNDKKEPMLSTIDNPFNPFKHFDQWNQFDQAKGYNTLAYLGRVVDYSKCVTEDQRREARELAIENILRLNPLPIYCKVYEYDTIVPMSLNEKN